MVHEFENGFHREKSLKERIMQRIDDRMRHIEKYIKHRKEMEKRISEGRYELIEDTTFSYKIIKFDGIDYEAHFFGNFKSYSELNS